MRLPQNHFEWTTLWLTLAAAAVGLFLLFSIAAQAHIVRYKTSIGDIATLDFEGFKNPSSGYGCCGSNDCVQIDASKVTWIGDAVSFIYPVDDKRYWLPRSELDGSPNQMSYGCVVGKGDPDKHPAFPDQRKARCLLLTGST